MPQKGETVMIGDFEYKITLSDSRRIQTMQVTIPKDHPVTGKVTD